MPNKTKPRKKVNKIKHVVKIIPKKKEIVIVVPKKRTIKKVPNLIPRNNKLKKKTENWLQKTKLLSSALEYASLANPIAKFGLHYARSQGYGRKRGGAIRRHISSSKNTPANVSNSSSWGTRLKDTAYKYRYPLGTAAFFAVRHLSKDGPLERLPYGVQVFRGLRPRRVFRGEDLPGYQQD